MPDTAAAPDARIAGTVQRYLTGSETLRLTVYNSAANVRVSIAGRRFPYGGTTVSEFASTLTPTTNRLATVLDLTPGEGWLLGLAVRVVAGSPLEGQTYVVVEIGNGAGATFQPFDTLIADTVTSAHRVAWPGSPIRGPLDGPGAVRVITGSTPAAGAEISETVPTGARWELKTLWVVLVASATVATRTPQLRLDDGTTTLMQVPSVTQLVASQTAAAEFAQGMPYAAQVNALGAPSGLPVNNRLAAGHRIRTSTSNIQVGDQYGAPQYVVVEWLEGA